jgi:hypothetical protein
MEKDKSYRFRLPTELFEAASAKAKRQDLTLAQVIRRFLREWLEDDSPPEEAEPED